MAANNYWYDLLLARLGRRNDTNLRDHLALEFTSATEELELDEFLPWFLEVQGSFTSVQGQSSYDLPTAYIRSIENQQPRVVTSDESYSLIKMPPDQFNEKYQNVNFEQIPRNFTIYNGKFWVGPAPDEAGYTLTFPYYGKTAAIPDNDQEATNPWLINAPHVLLDQVGYRTALFYIQSEELASRFAGSLQNTKRKLYFQHEAREHTDMNYSDVDEFVGENFV